MFWSALIYMETGLTINQRRLCLLFLLIDDYIHYTWVYKMKHKHELYDHGRNLNFLVELKLSCLTLEGSLFSFAISSLIKGPVPNYYFPKPLNKMVLLNAKTIIFWIPPTLYSFKGPLCFWGEPLLTATYFVNRCPVWLNILLNSFTKN